MGIFLRELLHGLLELLFPNSCIGCGKLEPHELCPACQAAIPALSGQRCAICASTIDAGELCQLCRTKPPAFTAAHARSSYTGTLRKAILHWKYQKHRNLSQPLGTLLAEYALKLEGIAEVAMITWVPLHPLKEQERGFNQAFELAHRVSQASGIPCHACLQRVRPTQTQTRLSFHERRKNVREAFSLIQPGTIAGKGILLIDDVMTTGATLRECAGVLKTGGADKVYALVLARD